MKNSLYIYTLPLTILMLCTTACFAGNITGIIVDENEEPIISANVILISKEKKQLTKVLLSDEQGKFEFDNVDNGSYSLKISTVGYAEYSKDDVEMNNSDITLPLILLKRKSNTLKEVSVKGQKPLIEVKADRLIVNVENSIVNAGSSALEVLSKSPNVQVDQNDNISIKGKQGVNVMIDGRLMAISGTDLANMLKSMPANSIEKIEIISNPGAKYDAAGVGGIINIRTKRDSRMGINGSVNASYAQGVYPKYNAGGNLNYRNKKISAYASYNYAKRWWFNNLILNRKFYNSSEQLLSYYDQDNFSKMAFLSHNATFGLDYSLSKKTTIGTAITGGSFGFNPEANNRSSYRNANDEVIYYFNTKGNHQNQYNNYTVNLNLHHRFDSTGKELTVDADYARYWSSANQNFITNYTYTDGVTTQPDYYMRSDLSGLTQIRSVKADYTQPMSGNAKFEAGVKSSYVTSDNEPLFYEKTIGDYQLDTRRSNHFIYRENINAAYVNGNKDWEKWGVQLGLRVENTNVTADQITLDSTYEWDYTQLFPSVAVQHHLSKNHDLGITLSRRIQRPNYQQLNPFKYYIDNTTYREGYPYLRPALTYSVEASHTFKKRFVTTLNYSVTNNNITEVIQPSETDTGKVTVQTNKNLTRVNYYGISGAYPFRITKWWNNVTSVNLYYAQYIGNIANTNLNNGAPAFTLNTQNSFILPKGFAVELSGWYQSKQVYGYMNLQAMWMANAGIQKNLWNNNATIKLNVQDAFWKGYPRATSEYTQYRESFVAIRDSRQVSLTFTYRFGNKKVSPIRKRRGGADDEKSRVGNAGG